MKRSAKSAWTFIVLIGVISLFADMTHEGARSITGPYLAMWGASATVVGFVAGFGELVGYAFRLVAGYIADKTQCYWLIVFVGYILNLVAVPLLAVAGNWPMAAVLIVLERLGRAIRNPARDTMLSHATSTVGHGTGFGIHEALDQIGAVVGPLIVATVYYLSNSYTLSFEVLWIPATITLLVLLVARWVYPDTRALEIVQGGKRNLQFRSFYWMYLVAISLVAAGFADYPLIAYHFQKAGQVAIGWIPLLYAVAMGTDALAALVMGRLFDRFGMVVLTGSCVCGLGFAPLVFLGNFTTAVCGMICWGIGMAAQESLMRAVLAATLAPDKRATGFGVFNAVFGLCWFLGSCLMGWLYVRSIHWLIVFSVAMQLGALPLFIKLSTSFRRQSSLGH